MATAGRASFGRLDKSRHYNCANCYKSSCKYQCQCGIVRYCDDACAQIYGSVHNMNKCKEYQTSLKSSDEPLYAFKSNKVMALILHGLDYMDAYSENMAGLKKSQQTIEEIKNIFFNYEHDKWCFDFIFPDGVLSQHEAQQIINRAIEQYIEYEHGVLIVFYNGRKLTEQLSAYPSESLTLHKLLQPLFNTFKTTIPTILINHCYKNEYYFHYDDTVKNIKRKPNFWSNKQNEDDLKSDEKEIEKGDRNYYRERRVLHETWIAQHRDPENNQKYHELQQHIYQIQLINNSDDEHLLFKYLDIALNQQSQSKEVSIKRLVDGIQKQIESSDNKELKVKYLKPSKSPFTSIIIYPDNERELNGDPPQSQIEIMSSGFNMNKYNAIKLFKEAIVTKSLTNHQCESILYIRGNSQSPEIYGPFFALLNNGKIPEQATKNTINWINSSEKPSIDPNPTTPMKGKKQNQPSTDSPEIDVNYKSKQEILAFKRYPPINPLQDDILMHYAAALRFGTSNKNFYDHYYVSIQSYSGRNGDGPPIYSIWHRPIAEEWFEKVMLNANDQTNDYIILSIKAAKDGGDLLSLCVVCHELYTSKSAFSNHCFRDKNYGRKHMRELKRFVLNMKKVKKRVV